MRDFIAKAFNKLAKYLGDRFEQAILKVKFPQTDIRPVVAALSKVETAVKNAKPAEFSGTVKVDQTEILRELRAATKAINSITLEQDDSNVVNALEKLIKTIESQKPADYTDLLKAIQGLKFDAPDTVRLDQTQVDRLSMSRGHTTDHIREANRVTVANVSMSSASTEYSYTFPARTVSWEMRVRDNDNPLLVAYETGVLPTSGDGSAYFTVPAYYVRTNDGMAWGNKTIYLQTADTSQVCEIISYQAS